MFQRPMMWAFAVTAFLLAGCGSKEDLLKKGQEFAKQGKYEDASLQFRKALQKDERYGEAYLELGKLFVKQEKPREAYSSFVKAQELMPQSEEATVAMGREALSLLLMAPQRPKVLYDSVSKASQALLAKNPKHVQGLRMEGYLRMVDGKTKLAVESFQKARAAAPDDPEVAVLLVQNLLIDGQNEEAERTARQAIERARTYGPLYDTLYLHLTTQKRMADAEVLLKLKLANNPKQAFFAGQLADHYWSQKQTVEAEGVAQELAGDRSNYPEALLEAANFYRRVGKPAEAIAAARRGVSEDAGNKKRYLESALETQLQDNRVAEALATTEELLKADPNDDKARATLAYLRLASGKSGEAAKGIQEIEALLQKKPDDLDLRTNLGSAYRQAGRTEDARNAWQAVLQKSPGHRKALLEMASLQLEMQNPDLALQHAEKLLQLEPANYRARLIRTSSLVLKGRTGEARTELKQLTAQYPSVTDPLVQLAMLETQEKRFGEAERILRALGVGPAANDPRLTTIWVSLYQARGEAGKALGAAQEGAKKNNTPQARALVAEAAAQAGDVKLAVATLDQLKQEQPGNPMFALRKGEMLAQAGDTEGALRAYAEAKQVAPKNAVVLTKYGSALGEAGRSAEAVREYREALAVAPESGVVCNNLAWELASSGGDLQEARQLAGKALKQDGSNPYFQSTLAYIDLKAKRLPEAVQGFQALVRKDPGNPDHHFNLGMALAESGNKAGGRAEIESALRLKPPAGERVKMERYLAGL